MLQYDARKGTESSHSEKKAEESDFPIVDGEISVSGDLLSIKTEGRGWLRGQDALKTTRIQVDGKPSYWITICTACAVQIEVDLPRLIKSLGKEQRISICEAVDAQGRASTAKSIAAGGLYRINFGRVKS